MDELVFLSGSAIPMILVVVPIAAFGAYLLLVHNLSSDRDWRESFLMASVIWGVSAVVVAEILSALSRLAQDWLVLSWLILLFIALVLLWATRTRRVRLRWLKLMIPAESNAKILLVAILAIVLITAVVAWISPPNTWDALTYHMSRVAQWNQNQTLNHFATGIEAQNFMSPGASIFVLQFYILGNGDRLVNFIQWFAMVASLIGISLIAKQLGAGLAGQLLAALFVATLPTGILQATSAFNDYVVAFWVVCVAYWAIEASKGVPKRTGLLFIGGSAGLALLTKQTSLPFLIPLGILTAFGFFNSRSKLMSLAWGIAGLVLALSLNLGHWRRNVDTYGSIAGPQERVGHHLNQWLDYRMLVSNTLRNAALNLGTPSPHVNKAFALGILKIHEWMNLDANDPRTTAEGKFRIKTPSTHETVAGNLLHALAIASVMAIMLFRRKNLSGSSLTFAIILVASYLILSAVFQWKVTGSRYQLPFFALAGALVGLVVAQSKNQRMVVIVGAVLLLGSVPWLIGNQARPLVSGVRNASVNSILVEPRQQLYFSNGPYLEIPYREMTALIRADQCNTVGLMLLGYSAEYPLWVLLGAPNRQLAVHWIVAGTPSEEYEPAEFAPCAVICENCPTGWSEIRGLPLHYERGPYRLYLDPRT